MKKTNAILTFLIIFLCGMTHVEAADYDYYCTKEAASQLAKIVYNEVGADSANNQDENFFMKLSTAAIAINNANSKQGNTFYEQVYNLTDSNYDGYSKYKNESFESVVPFSNRGEVLYIAELVLTGKYTFPSNMTLQASKEIVEQYGTIWSGVSSMAGYHDIYFGYENNNLNETNIYNDKINNTSVEYYKNLANDLKKNDYSEYTIDTVCSGKSSHISNNNTTPNGNPIIDNQTSSNTAFGVCENPDILRVIYFFLIIIDIVKIIIPIALIIFGLIDFSKAVIVSDEKVQKKSVNLFLKRLLYAVLVFAVPWIVEVLMVTLGDMFGEEGQVNFTDCIQNANSEKIAELEEKIEQESNKQNNSGNTNTGNGNKIPNLSEGDPTGGGDAHVRE